ncbi:hypothetical protein Mapa_010179 [Marchantia paleacea]|nr:hypothetical protein Mapa_010179 [Marchantia paleacea]
MVTEMGGSIVNSGVKRGMEFINSDRDISSHSFLNFSTSNFRPFCISFGCSDSVFNSTRNLPPVLMSSRPITITPLSSQSLESDSEDELEEDDEPIRLPPFIFCIFFLALQSSMPPNLP